MELQKHPIQFPSPRLTIDFHYQSLDQNDHSHNLETKNYFDDKDRLSRWNQSHSLKIKSRIRQLKKTSTPLRQINTDRSNHNIFDYTTFQRIRPHHKQQNKKYQSNHAIIPKQDEKIIKNQAILMQKIKYDKKKNNPAYILPIAFNTTTLEFEKFSYHENISNDQRKNLKKSMVKLDKKHLVKNINYKQIEQALFKQPVFTNRFHEFCKKIQNHNNLKKNIPQQQMSVSKKVKIINFSAKIISKLQKNVDKEKDVKITRNNFNKTFFLRNKMNQTNMPQFIDMQMLAPKKKEVLK